MSCKCWETVLIDQAPIEIIDGDRGKNYPKKEELSDKGFCLFLNTGNVTNDGFSFEKNQFITSQKDAVLRKGKLKREDIVLTTRGTVGNVGYYTHEIEFDNLRINSGMVILRVKDEKKVFGRFLYQFLRSSLFKEQVSSFTSGSAQPQLPIKDLRRIKITLPPVQIQYRIADTLSSLEEKIMLNRQINQTLEAIAQAIFKEWFVEFNFPGATGEMQESYIGEIPKGWRFEKLGDIYKTTSGGTPSRSKPEYYENGTIPWIKSKELNNSFITQTEECITESGLNNSSAKLLPKYSVLIAMYGATVGEVGITSLGATCNQAICAFISNENYPFTFLFQFLRYNKADIISRAVGSAQQNISQELLKEIDVLVPPVELLREYHRITSSLFYSIENNICENQTLTKLRDTLLPRLIKGEIPITETEKLVAAV